MTSNIKSEGGGGSSNIGRDIYSPRWGFVVLLGWGKLQDITPN
jgi:hypothetical protein